MMPRGTACRLAIAIVLVALALSGCSGANKMRSVSQLVKGGRSQRAIKTGGEIATEPTRTAEGMSFTVVDPDQRSHSIDVLYTHSLPPLDDHGPKHYSGRRIIIRGDFDGRRVTATTVIVQRFETYQP